MNFRRSNYLLVGALLLTTIFAYLQLISAYYLLLPITVWIAGLVAGSANIRSNYFLQAYHQHPSPSGHHIAITFDDGPHPEFTPKVLELLKAHDIRATFFCIGKRVSLYPVLTQRIQQAGHMIGNHSYSHASTIDFGNSKRWIREIRNTDQAIERATGMLPRLFRPPYGVTTPHLATALKYNQHRVIGWSIRPYDTTNASTENLLARIKKKIRPGSILLLHDTHDKIIPLLERLLPYLKAENYSFVTVDEMISTC